MECAFDFFFTLSIKSWKIIILILTRMRSRIGFYLKSSSLFCSFNEHVIFLFFFFYTWSFIKWTYSRWIINKKSKKEFFVSDSDSEETISSQSDSNGDKKEQKSQNWTLNFATQAKVIIPEKKKKKLLPVKKQRPKSSKSTRTKSTKCPINWIIILQNLFNQDIMLWCIIENYRKSSCLNWVKWFIIWINKYTLWSRKA